MKLGRNCKKHFGQKFFLHFGLFFGGFEISKPSFFVIFGFPSKKFFFSHRNVLLSSEINFEVNMISRGQKHEKSSPSPSTHFPYTDLLLLQLVCYILVWIPVLYGHIWFNMSLVMYMNKISRRLKFKRALRLQFWLNFQNLFCRFLTSKLWSDPDMINPSIKTSDFLFWHEKSFESNFWKFCRNQTN